MHVCVPSCLHNNCDEYETLKEHWLILQAFMAKYVKDGDHSSQAEGQFQI